MDQIYDKYADLPSLEKQTAKILKMFDDVEAGILKLKDLGININTSKSAKGVDDLNKKIKEQGSVIDQQRAQLTKMVENLAKLTTQEAKHIEQVKQVTALTKSLTTEETKQQIIRQGAYADLQAQKIANQELAKSIQLRIKLRNSEKGSLEQMQLQYQKLSGILTKAGESTKETERFKRLSKAADELKNKINEQQKSMGNFSANVGRYAESLGAGFASVREEISKLQAKQASLQDFAKRDPVGFKLGGNEDDLNRTTAALDKLNQVTQIGFKTNQSYSVTVKQVEKAYQDMAASGNFSEEFLKEFKKFAAEAKDSAADLRDEIKAMSSDTRQLDLVTGAITTLVSGFQAAVGVAELFGDENEDIQRSVQKLIAVQNIANGVREVGEQITKRGTAANKAYNFVLKEGKILFDASSTAARKFQSLLKFTGIGLAITAIGYLAEKMGLFGGETEEAEKAVEKLNKAFEAQEKILNRISSSIDQEGKIQLEKIKQIQAARDDSRKSELDKEKQQVEDKQQLAEANVKVLENQYRLEYDAQIVAGKKLAEADAKILEYRELKRQGFNRFRKIHVDGKSIEQLQKEQEATKEYYDKREAAAVAAEANLNLAREQVATGSIEDLKQINQKKFELNREADQREKQAQLDLLKYEQNRIKEKNDLIASEDSFASATRKTEAVKKSAEAQMAILIAQKKFDESQEKVAASKLILIRKEFNDNKKDLEFETEKKITEIWAQEIKRRQDLQKVSAEDFDIDMEERFNKQLEASQRALEIDIRTNDKNAAALQEQNALNFKAGLKTKEEYDKRKQDIEESHQRILLGIQIRYAEEQIALLKANGEDTTDLEVAVAEAKAKLAEDGIEKAKERNEREKAIIAETKQNYLDAYLQIGEAFTNTLGAIGEKRKQDLQDQIDKVDELKEAEIARISKTGEAEETKAAKIAIVEANAQIKKDQLARRQRQIDRQQAIIERGFKAFQIATDTIVGINKIKLLIAAAPDPITKALYSSQLVLAITSGALALTSLLAQKLPGYWTGTEYSASGHARVAEKGRELFVTPDKKVGMWTSPTIANLKGGTKIFSNRVTEDIIKAAGQDIVHPAIAFVEPVKQTDNHSADILWELRKANKRPPLLIKSSYGIETTAWWHREMKS